MKKKGNFVCTIEGKKWKKSDEGITLDEQSSNGKALSEEVFSVGMFWFQMFAFKTSLGSKCPGQNIPCPLDLFLCPSLPCYDTWLQPRWLLLLPEQDAEIPGEAFPPPPL